MRPSRPTRYMHFPHILLTINSDSSIQIDVAVNAPEAGTIKEFLVNEEDTVNVGQDIVKMETGGKPSGDKAEKAGSEPKDAASSEQETSSQPEGGKEKESSKEEKKPEPKKDEPKQESKPAPKQESMPEPPKPKEETKPAPPAKKSDKKDDKPKQESAYGNRDERRVSLFAYLTQ